MFLLTVAQVVAGFGREQLIDMMIRQCKYIGPSHLVLLLFFPGSLLFEQCFKENQLHHGEAERQAGSRKGRGGGRGFFSSSLI